MQRPTSVTVFGILNILFALLGFCGGAFNFVFLFAQNVLGKQLMNNPAFKNNPAMDLMQKNPTYLAVLKAMTVLGLLASLVLLASGIGLLMMKAWARKVAIGYAIYAICAGVIGTALSYIYVVSPLMMQAQGKQGPEAVGAIGGAIGGMCGGCFVLIYPVILLIFMLRSSMANAFRVSAEPMMD